MKYCRNSEVSLDLKTKNQRVSYKDLVGDSGYSEATRVCADKPKRAPTPSIRSIWHIGHQRCDQSQKHTCTVDLSLASILVGYARMLVFRLSVQNTYTLGVKNLVEPLGTLNLTNPYKSG